MVTSRSRVAQSGSAVGVDVRWLCFVRRMQANGSVSQVRPGSRKCALVVVTRCHKQLPKGAVLRVVKCI